MDSMYADVNSYHGVCDPHMNGLSLTEMIDCDIQTASGFEDVNTSPQEFQHVDSQMNLFDDVLNEPNSSDLSWSNLTPTLNNPSIASGLGGNGGADGVLSNYMDDFGHCSAGIVSVDPNAVMPVTSTVHQNVPVVISAASMSHSPHDVCLQTTTNVVGGNNTLSVNTQYVNSVQQSSLSSPAQPSSVGYPPESLLVHPRQTQMPPQLSPLVTSSYPQSPGPTSGNIQHIPIRGQQLATHQSVVRQNVVGGGTTGGVKTVKVLPVGGNPMQLQNTTVIHHHHQQQQQGGAVAAAAAATRIIQQQPQSNTIRKKNLKHAKVANKENGYPKPAYSYSCLIALSLKNSVTGHLSVSEIYKFMCEHFPYFQTAPSGWKNSVRHNLSLNKCFEKIEKPTQPGSNQRKGCLWAMNPAKITKMDEEVLKWSRKDPMAIKKGMVAPHTLEKLERGEMQKDYNANTTANEVAGPESEDEEDPKTPTSLSSLGSQGYDSAGSDFVDVEGNFSAIPDSSSLPELHLQSGGIFEGLMDEGLQFSNVQQAAATATSQFVRLTNGQRQRVHAATSTTSSGYYPPAIHAVHANYAIAPAAAVTATATSTSVNVVSSNPAGMKTLVVTRQEGSSRVFTVGGPALH